MRNFTYKTGYISEKTARLAPCLIFGQLRERYEIVINQEYIAHFDALQCDMKTN